MTSMVQAISKMGIWAPINLVNKQNETVKKTWMIDSGSNWSLMRSGTCDAFKVAERPIPDSLTLCGASGRSLSGVNIQTYVLKMGSTLVATEFFMLSPGEGPSYGILGLTLLNQLRATLDLAKKEIRFVGKNGQTECVKYRSRQYDNETITSIQEEKMNEDVMIISVTDEDRKGLERKSSESSESTDDEAQLPGKLVQYNENSPWSAICSNAEIFDDFNYDWDKKITR